MSTMARGKTKIALITDEKMLKSTYQKRKKGLIKKVKELATLCDIVACVIIYGPAIGGRPPEIFTWPEEQDKVLAAIRMYKEKMDHSKRKADLCNYLKDRRRPDGADHSAGYVAEGFPERQQGNLSISVELAAAYLNWVDARIKAVADRIELVKSSLRCQNMMLDNTMPMPAGPNQERNFRHGFMQEWCYPHSPCQDFTQFDLGAYDEALCANDHPLYTNIVLPDTVQFPPHPIISHQQKQILFQNFYQTHTQNENQNQMLLNDPYLLRMDYTNSAALNVNCSQCYHHHQQHDEKLQYSNNVATSSNMDDRMQLCPYPDEWPSPNTSSSNYSTAWLNHFSKEAIDAPNFDDHLELILQRPEYAAEFQPPEDGGTLPGDLIGI